jgi:hypothetical protein
MLAFGGVNTNTGIRSFSLWRFELLAAEPWFDRHLWLCPRSGREERDRRRR